MTRGDRPTVLVVEDVPSLRALYEGWLGEAYDTRTAATGREALSMLDAGVDVALLDRRLPGISGGAVLEEIRERDVDCRVAMVTGVEPDVDVIEMGFDDYLVKPVSKDRLLDLVESLLATATYDEALQEYYATVAKWSLLRHSLSAAEREESERFAALERRVARRRREVDGLLAGFDGAEYEGLFRLVVHDGSGDSRQTGGTGSPSPDGSGGPVTE